VVNIMKVCVAKAAGSDFYQDFSSA